MLDVIRRHQQSWLTYLIFLAIIVVFIINFGPGSSGCQGTVGGSIAASVDGDAIRQAEYAMLLSRRLDSMRKSAMAANMELNEQLIERMGIRKQVIDQLIDKKLLAQEAARRGIVISDEDLLKYLEDSYGVKDVTPEQYKSWVERTFQTSVPRFEDDVRDELGGQTLMRVISESVTVSDAELKRAYFREHDRAMVSFVRFEVKPDAETEPSAAQIDEVLAKESAAVSERYNTELFKFNVPETRQARQIVVSLPPGAPEAEVQKAKAQLMDLRSQIEGGADFAALAKQHSQDAASKDKGGDMGWIKHGQVARPLEEAIFGLSRDELVKEPVKTPRGLHLVQLVDLKPAAKKELKEVEREVAAALLKERASEAKAVADANALIAQLKGGKTLEELTVSEDDKRGAKGDAAKEKALEGKLVRVETPWLTKDQEAIPRIGLNKELHAAIFAANKDKPIIEAPYKVGRGYFVVVLKDREAPDEQSFASKKDEMKQQQVWEKRSAVMQEWLKHLRSQARVELNPQLFPEGDGEGIKVEVQDAG